MSNPFLQLVKKANDLNWCTQPYCTTCGSLEYHNELKKLSGELGGQLSNALSELDPNEITKIENWCDALTIAFIDLHFSLQVESILESWFKKIKVNINFTDFVLFNIIKCFPSDNQIHKKWVSECINIALEKNCFSLVESLILVLGKDTLKNPELLELGKEFASSSDQMKRVLLNACNIRLPKA
ncbi:MAG: hypothetical protein KAI43_01100 [Candidatus Aureabacteria bacterium]|nr:hypothetical protein [Candidatus Auribacterota bacterium]